jgi:hypothetical protein
MSGFTRLASYNYFAHVERALEARFRKAGLVLKTHVSDVLPTASVRRRAARLAEARRPWPARRPFEEVVTKLKLKKRVTPRAMRRIHRRHLEVPLSAPCR